MYAMDPITLLLIVGVVVLVVFLVRRPRHTSQRLADSVPPSGRTSTLAVTGFVLSFVISVPAVVLGHMALSQIAKTGDSGRGLALASLWIGYTSMVLALLAIFVLPHYLSQGRY